METPGRTRPQWHKGMESDSAAVHANVAQGAPAATTATK